MLCLVFLTFFETDYTVEVAGKRYISFRPFIHPESWATMRMTPKESGVPSYADPLLLNNGIA